MENRSFSLNSVNEPCYDANHAFQWNGTFSGFESCWSRYGTAVLVCWCFVECLFYLVVRYLVYPTINKFSDPHPTKKCVASIKKRYMEFLGSTKCYTFEKYLSGLHRGAKFEDIKLGNFTSFLAWSLWSKPLDALQQDELSAVNEVIDHGRRHIPAVQQLPEGHNHEIKHLSYTLDAIPYSHRPLLLGVVTQTLEYAANHLFLHWTGFQRRELNGMGYWIRKCEGGDNGSQGCEPVLILHGISTGWMAYANMVHAFAKNRTAVLIDLEAVKVFSLNFNMPTPEEFSAGITSILDKHSIARVSVVGHSFGSITANWFVSRFPDRVSHLTLLDPAAILLSFPEVAHYFLYRTPDTFSYWMSTLASREITLATMIHRHFWWYNNDLWIDDLAPHIGVVVGVGSKDEVICAEAVREHVLQARDRRMRAAKVRPASPSCVADSCTALDGSTHLMSSTSAPAPTIAAVECVMWENYIHGQILMTHKPMRDLVQLVHKNEKSQY